jgi:hypothetical protein
MSDKVFCSTSGITLIFFAPKGRSQRSSRPRFGIGPGPPWGQIPQGHSHGREKNQLISGLAAQSAPIPAPAGR